MHRERGRRNCESLGLRDFSFFFFFPAGNLLGTAVQLQRSVAFSIIFVDRVDG